MTTTHMTDEFRDRFANATPNDVDNYAHRIETKLGYLPPDVQLTLEAYDDSKLSAPDALGYLALYEIAYSAAESSAT